MPFLPSLSGKHPQQHLPPSPGPDQLVPLRSRPRPVFKVGDLVRWRRISRRRRLHRPFNRQRAPSASHRLDTRLYPHGQVHLHHVPSQVGQGPVHSRY